MRTLDVSGNDRTSESPVAKVKGSLVIARMTFLRGKGPGAVEEVLRTLPAADQDVLRGMLLPSSWYAAEMVERLEDAIGTVLSTGDRAACFAAMGRLSAELNLGPQGVRRPYIHEGDPHHVLECVPRIYTAVYEKGRRTYERTAPRSAVIRGYDTAYSHGHCWATIGWLQRIVELSGATGVRVTESQCQSAGAPWCEYPVTWAAP